MSCKVPTFDGLHWQFQLHGQKLEVPNNLGLVKEYVVEIWVDFKLADIIPFNRGTHPSFQYGLYPTLLDPNVKMKMFAGLTELRIELKVFEVSCAANMVR